MVLTKARTNSVSCCIVSTMAKVHSTTLINIPLMYFTMLANVVAHLELVVIIVLGSCSLFSCHSQGYPILLD